jgi:hypothetical protein
LHYKWNQQNNCSCKCVFQVRIISTVLVGIRSNLNLKEKIFIALAWMAKATVQVSVSVTMSLAWFRKFCTPINFKKIRNSFIIQIWMCRNIYLPLQINKNMFVSKWYYNIIYWIFLLSLLLFTLAILCQVITASPYYEVHIINNYQSKHSAYN